MSETSNRVRLTLLGHFNHSRDHESQLFFVPWAEISSHLVDEKRLATGKLDNGTTLNVLTCLETEGKTQEFPGGASPTAVFGE